MVKGKDASLVSAKISVFTHGGGSQWWPALSISGSYQTANCINLLIFKSNTLQLVQPLFETLPSISGTVDKADKTFQAGLCLPIT